MRPPSNGLGLTAVSAAMRRYSNSGAWMRLLPANEPTRQMIRRRLFAHSLVKTRARIDVPRRQLRAIARTISNRQFHETPLSELRAQFKVLKAV